MPRERLLFAGDTIYPHATIIVANRDSDLRQYAASLQLLSDFLAERCAVGSVLGNARALLKLGLPGDGSQPVRLDPVALLGGEPVSSRNISLDLCRVLHSNIRSLGLCLRLYGCLIRILHSNILGLVRLQLLPSCFFI